MYCDLDPLLGMSRLSSSDAYLFPVLASAALLGMYLVFKYLGSVGLFSVFALVIF